MASKQNNQNGVTLFESIPNEIFVEILSYITSIDAVIALSNLNWRFQKLLIEFCHTFDFTSISKKKFDAIFQYQNTNRWHSLKLSDAKHTPGQVSYFFENHALANKFSQLRSLSIVNIIPNHPYPLFAQLSSLSNLVSLEIESLCGENIPEFKLPNLKKITFSSCPNTSWLKNFVGLETIEYTITDRCTKVNLLVWPQALKYLKIVYEDYRDCILIQQSLTDLSQLNDLEVYQKQPGGSLPRGEIWTQIISASVPSLKNFKFYFQFICHKHQLNQLKEVVASFSTRFYKLEKNLIVRCDVSDRYETIFHDVEYDTNNTNMRRVILYTIPFGFEVFTVFKTFLKSKILDWPRNYIDYRSTNMHTNVKTLILKSYSTPDPMFNGTFIINLIINTFFDALPWIHNLTKLRHITIGDDAALSVEDFNILLDHASNLRSLTAKKSRLKFLTDNWTDTCICNRLTRRIRSLKFSSDRNPSQCFDINELERILPIFSSQCQHLSLGIHSHNKTIDFILRKMCHLISLHVFIQRKNFPPITVEWLQQQNTRFNGTNCIITNARQDYYFWLG
ncbi:unnamed protein product [Rotaria magnacalcarata]|uniref:F-box domain-containing protein n=1 Tax=Rotaria magnacalcarata TaxID=392030 RepID=A0A819VTT2_9BILA|nr:unnamed protein product [Rotaria magnacalcarata]CAF2072467.1 unnamed protein product [Rotaria magnacalcarata]CAF4112789.1 unnamed protein product [Rotaria magnacalcarata]CAF4198747.1 unnamed protein product [Rotaria magnacalcarata]